MSGVEGQVGRAQHWQGHTCHAATAIHCVRSCHTCGRPEEAIVLTGHRGLSLEEDFLFQVRRLLTLAKWICS